MSTCPPGTTVCIFYPAAPGPSAAEAALAWSLVVASGLAAVVLLLLAASLAVAIRRGVREQRGEADTSQT